MRFSALILPLVIWVPASLPAQDVPPRYQPSEEFARCMKQDDAVRGSAAAIDTCINTEQTVQQQRLSDAYDRAFDALTGWDQVRLYNDQTEWREGLDARCAEVATSDPRNATSSRAFNLCRAEEMGNRAAWLDDYEPE